jgi:hypothetical protein
MFGTIPSELELYIWTLYFNSEVIPEIINAGIEKNTRNIYKSIMPDVIEYSIKEKASRIINSIVNKEVLVDSENLNTLDEMYYNLLSVHHNNLYDIFEL